MQIKATFTVVVKPSTTSDLKVDPNGGNLPDETQGTAVAGDPVCMISGGTPPYSLQVTEGQVPPGCAITTEPPAADGSVQVLIEGTPSQSGAFSFGLTVTDSSVPAKKANVPVSAKVAPAA